MYFPDLPFLVHLAIASYAILVGLLWTGMLIAICVWLRHRLASRHTQADPTIHDRQP